MEVIIVLWLLVLSGVIALVYARHPWRYDERNPARRYCKECGQQQDLWDGPYSSTWEYMGSINTKCSQKHRI
jgi:hypothetical protein